MSNCSNHKKEVAGISNMKLLAEMIGDLHYESLYQLLLQLYKKIDSDSKRDNEAGREKLASALQYLGYVVFEATLRAEKVWQISEPFMQNKVQNLEVSDTTES